MKRKIDESGELAPAAAEIVVAKTTSSEPTFADLGLDPRLVQAIAKEKFEKPTLVQRTAIPLALDGQDVLAKAKTGSGKTLAYILPVLQSILKRKQTDSTAFTAALILVPTRELADQVFKVIETFSAFCSKDIQTAKLTDKVSEAVQRSILSNNPDIVISTPSKAWLSIDSSAMKVHKLSHLIIDEADLVLSYGYDEDLENISTAIPKGVQTILMSATLTAEVDTLKALFCRSPKLLDLEEPDAEGEGVKQFMVKVAEDEKFLLAYVIFKLQLVKGKCIIFVADVDRCYRLKLFFEQFGIRSTILNSELPVNSRIHVVEEFNRNVYDILIASDENEVIGDEDDEAQPEKAVVKKKEEVAETKETKDGEPESKRPKKKRRTIQRDKEYGVSRGIDFKNVACVINFDLPTSSKSYTHRIGRTARAGQTGMALSFYVPTDLYRKHMPTSVETAEHDEKVMAKIIKQQNKVGKEVKPYVFDMNQVEPFKYRMNDALRAVTKVSIREARTRELRNELLKSEKLKRHFEENPAELHHLRHDGELRAARTQAHLKHIPDYLLPAEGKKALTSQQIGFVPLNKLDKREKTHKGGKFKPKAYKVGSRGGRKGDPLKSFKGRRKPMS